MSWSDFSFANSPIVVWGLHTEPGETTTQVLLVACIYHCTHVVLCINLCVDFLVQIRKFYAQLGLSSILILLQFFYIHVKHWTITTGQFPME